MAHLSMQALFALIYLASEGPGFACELIRPVAPDEAAARRIAEAVVRNVPPSERARHARESGRVYELVIQPAEDEPAQWIAFERPQRDATPPQEGVVVLQFAGHGLAFRIDRCTGAISRMHFSR